MSITTAEPGTPEDFSLGTDADERAAAAGVTVAEPQVIDYFGFDETHTFYLDGTKTQYFLFKVLNEGQLAQFQKNTSRDVIMQRSTGNAKMRMDPASERHELIKAAVVGWRLYRKAPRLRGSQSGPAEGSLVEVPFGKGDLNEVLDKFPSSVISKLEKAIRDANPSLKPDQTIEEIDEAIALLQKDRAELVGKASDS